MDYMLEKGYFIIYIFGFIKFRQVRSLTQPTEISTNLMKETQFKIITTKSNGLSRLLVLGAFRAAVKSEGS